MRRIMATLLTVALTVVGAQPAFAEDPTGGTIRATAERLAAETELEQADVGLRRSGARVGLGVALAAAGVAMLLVDPKQPTQPTQPGTVSPDALDDAALQNFPTNHLAVRGAVGATILVCEPLCIGAIDEAIRDAYGTGGVVGIVSTTMAIEDQPWTLYQGPFQPFVPYKERSPGLKYGGAALAVAGALIAGLWSTVPMSNSLTLGVTPHGAQVGKTFGF